MNNRAMDWMGWTRLGAGLWSGQVISWFVESSVVYIGQPSQSKIPIILGPM